MLTICCLKRDLALQNLDFKGKTSAIFEKTSTEEVVNFRDCKDLMNDPDASMQNYHDEKKGPYLCFTTYLMFRIDLNKASSIYVTKATTVVGCFTLGLANTFCKNKTLLSNQISSWI